MQRGHKNYLRAGLSETENQMGFKGYYYIAAVSARTAGTIKPDKELPVLSSGKYIQRTEKKFGKRNISGEYQIDFDEDRSLKFLVHTKEHATKLWTTIYKDGKPGYLVAVLDVGMDRIVAKHWNISLVMTAERTDFTHCHIT